MWQGRTNLLDVLEARAAERSQIAYRFLRDGRGDAVAWTYRDVNDVASYIARELLQRDLCGKRIMLTLEPSLLYIAALLGIMKAGAIAVPSFPPTSKRAKARFTSIFADCLPELVIADSRHVNAAERISAGLSGPGSGDPERRPNWLFLDVNSRMDSAAAARAQQRPLQTQIEPDTPALLQYTSGSTGVPKGVIITHGNLIANCQVMEQSLIGPAQQHVACSWLPPYHDMGLMGAIFLALYSGFPLIMMTPAQFAQNPYLWLKAISDHRVTVSPAPNFALELCVDAVSDAELASLDLSSLRQFYCGAEPIQPSTLERFRQRFGVCGLPDTAFVPCYGLAEATLFVSSKSGSTEPRLVAIDKQWLADGYAQPVQADGNAAARVVSCGQIAAGHELLIVDPAARRTVRSGMVGEIWLRGPSIAAGYWQRREETAATFQARIAGEESRGEFLRTGDLGFVLDGELFITGRINDVIVLADRHLQPQDVELSAMRCNQFIRANGVVAFSCNRQPMPQLIVVAELSRRFLFSKHGLDEVRHHVRAAVRADHGIVPSVIHLAPVGSIPLTTSGKVRRNACRNAYLDGTLPAIQAVGLTREGRLDRLAHVAVLGYD